MKPSKISVLGFQFHGGDQDGCLFALYPKNVKDTLVMIEDAKAFFRESGSKWADMTMISLDGQKEIVSLYLDQDKSVQSVLSKASTPNFADTTIMHVVKNNIDITEDTYVWVN